jgi:hypothetical protein
MRGDIEDYFLNPPPGSAAARAAEFGIDLTLTLNNLRLTPEERIRKLDDFIEGVAKLKESIHIVGPSDNAKQSQTEKMIEAVLSGLDPMALAPITPPDNVKLLLTKELIAHGFRLFDIAFMLNEPVRRTRYRWYRYRFTQLKALRFMAKKFGSSKLQQAEAKEITDLVNR